MPRRSRKRDAARGSDHLDGRLIWLLGAPRTGSTWLGRLLAAHDLIDLEDEPLVGAHLGVRTSATVPEVWRVDDDESVWSRERERPGYFLSNDTGAVWKPLLAELLRARFLTSRADVIERGGAVILKEPHGSEAASIIFEVLPASRLLWLVRDPRDVLDSVLDIVQHGWLGQGGQGLLAGTERKDALDVAARTLRVRMGEVAAAWAARPEQLRQRIRYEDLRADPEAHLAATFSWIGPAITAVDVARIVETHSFEALPAQETGPGQFHRQAQPGGWRESLSPEEQRWANDTFADHLSEHDYPAD